MSPVFGRCSTASLCPLQELFVSFVLADLDISLCQRSAVAVTITERNGECVCVLARLTVVLDGQRELNYRGLVENSRALNHGAVFYDCQVVKRDALELDARRFIFVLDFSFKWTSHFLAFHFQMKRGFFLTRGGGDFPFVLGLCFCKCRSRSVRRGRRAGGAGRWDWSIGCSSGWRLCWYERADWSSESSACAPFEPSPIQPPHYRRTSQQ